MRKTVGKITFAFLLALPLFLPGSWLFSQSAANGPELDHTTVFARDLPKSVEFYEKVVGLERIPDPFKDGRHIWFRSGAHQQLHIVGGAMEAARHDIDVHSAFRVASLPDFMTHLAQMHVT